jgi:hypothetical protein
VSESVCDYQPLQVLKDSHEGEAYWGYLVAVPHSWW